MEPVNPGVTYVYLKIFEKTCYYVLMLLKTC